MSRNPITGTNDPKSARYQFNWELPDNNIVRQNNGRIPGGKKYMGGAKIVSRSETYDTNEALKPMEGAGLFGDIGQAVDGVTSLFGLGKRCGGRKPKVNKPTKKQMEQMKKQKRMKGGMIAPLNTEYPLQEDEMEGAGLFGDIGNAVDSVGSLFGLGKSPYPIKLSKTKRMRGGMNANMDDIQQVKDQMDLLEGGIKNLKKLMKKIK